MAIHLNPHAIAWPQQETWIHSLVITPDSKTLIAACMDRKIHMWDIAERAPCHAPLEGHNNSIRCVGLSRDGRILLSGADEGDIRVWRIDDNPQCISVWRNIHKGAVRTLAINPDGTRCVSGGDDGMVRMWEVETGLEMGSPGKRHSHPINCVTFSDSGAHVASGDMGGVLSVWNCETGELVFKDFILGPDALTGAVAVPGVEEILTSCKDTTILHWALSKKAKVGDPWRGHKDSVQCIGLFPNAEEAVTGGSDSTLRLWDIPSGAPLGDAWLAPQMPIETIAISPDSSFVISAGADEMWTWNWEIEERPDAEHEIPKTEEEIAAFERRKESLQRFVAKRPNQVVKIDEPIPIRTEPIKASETLPSRIHAVEAERKKAEAEKAAAEKLAAEVVAAEAAKKEAEEKRKREEEAKAAAEKAEAEKKSATEPPKTEMALAEKLEPAKPKDAPLPQTPKEEPPKPAEDPNAKASLAETKPEIQTIGLEAKKSLENALLPPKPKPAAEKPVRKVPAALMEKIPVTEVEKPSPHHTLIWSSCAVAVALIASGWAWFLVSQRERTKEIEAQAPPIQISEVVNPEKFLPGPDDEYQIGRDYYEGKVVQQDYEKAMRWLSRAAAKNQPEAQYLLGLMYIKGQGIPADQEQGKMWLSRAASNENKDAILELERLMVK